MDQPVQMIKLVFCSPDSPAWRQQDLHRSKDLQAEGSLPCLPPLLEENLTRAPGSLSFHFTLK